MSRVRLWRQKLAQPLVLAGLLAALSVANLGVTLVGEYDDAVADATARSATLARTLEENTVALMVAAELLLKDAADRVPDAGWEGLDATRLRAHLAAALPAMFAGANVALLDDAGRMRFSLRTDLPVPPDAADREFFHFHHDNPASDDTHVGMPLIARGSGTLMLPISRPIRGADGRFLGVAAIGIDAHHFERFYRDVASDSERSATLFRTDGRMLLRAPFEPSLLGATFAGTTLFRHIGSAHAGSAVVDGILDPAQRLYAYRRVAGYPLIVTAGLPWSAVVADWRASALRDVASVGVLLAIVLAGAGAMQRAGAAVRRSHARRDSILAAAAAGIIVRDATGRITEANPAAAAILGRTADEIVAVGDGALPWRPVDADGRPLEGAGSPVRTALRSVRPLRDVVIGIHRPDGTRRWISVNVDVARGAGAEPIAVSSFVDITARFETEAALRASQERLAAVFAASGNGITVRDGTGRIVDANPAAEVILGFDRAALLAVDAGGPLPWRPVDAAERPIAPQDDPVLRAVRQGEEVRSAIVGVARPDGTRRWLALNTGVARDGAGAIAFVVSSFADVTERHEAEEAVRRSEARYRMLLQILPAAVLALRWDGRIAEANAAACRIFGAAGPADLVGRSYLDLIHASEQVDAVALRDQILAGASLPAPAERRFVALDGRVFVGEATGGYQLRAGGSELLVTVRDVTKRRAAERAVRDTAETLQLVLDHLPVSVSYYDTENRLRLVNRVGAAWLGQPAAALLGQRLEDLYTSADYAARRDLVRRVAAGELVESTGELQFPDGTVRTIELLLVPHAVDGAARGWLAFATDATARIATERQLRQAQKMEAVGQLTGGIAHDFNNLLAVIMGNLELLALEVANQEQSAAFVATALRAAARGAELTRRLLAFSRRQDLRPEEVEINALVAGLAALLGRTLGTNIAVETRLGDGLGRVVVDPGQLENALLNLAVNARDAMPEGGALSIVTAAVALDADDAARPPEAPPGLYDMIAVADTGCGMSPAVAARAFEPFFTTKEVGKGSGLGLSMVYGFVRQSGGHVALQSEPGRGTTVRIYLPRAGAPPPAGVADGAAGSATGAAPRPGRGQRVLLVEDDHDVRELVVMQLTALGYRVDAVAGGPEALAHLSRGGAFDLLLSDIVMPGGMSGLDLAAAARAARPGVPVLYMSGYSEGGAHAGRIAAEGAPLLAKPFTRAQLSEAVARALGAGGAA